MGTKMISMLYCYVKHRNGYLNYQGHPDRITFNPDSPEEKEMTWQELTEELIRRYSTKKPVKMTTIDAPEPVITLTESAAVKAFCEAYPKKLKTIMRICRRCKDNGEAAKAVQLDFAPAGFSSSSGSNVNYSFMSFTAGLEIEVNSEKVSMKYGRLIVEAKNLYDPFSSEFDIEPKKPEVKDDRGPAKCITGQSGSGVCGAAAYCDKNISVALSARTTVTAVAGGFRKRTANRQQKHRTKSSRKTIPVISPRWKNIWEIQIKFQMRGRKI